MNYGYLTFYKECRFVTHSLVRPNEFDTKECRAEIKVYSCPNNEIAVAKDFVCIYTREKQNYLGEPIKKVYEVIHNSILNQTSVRLRHVSYNVVLEDYLKNINNLKKINNDVKLDCKIEQQYNVKRNDLDYSKIRDMPVEHYSSQYISSYFTDEGISHYKDVSFSTAEYYDERIGRITTKIETFLLSADGSNYMLDRKNIYSDVKVLKNRAEEIYRNSFKEIYFGF